MDKNNGKNNYIIYIILLIITICLTAIALNSSPLYNGLFSADSSVFITMGNGILNHKIIYKDLFDHKGPIVYLINLIALLINKNFGLYIIETILIYINIIFIYKSAKLIIKNASNSIYILICSIYYLLLFTFITGGNLTEEYADVFIAIGLYYILRILNEKNIDNNKNWIMIGIMFTIVVFIKPSYIALWISFAIVAIIFFIKEKKYKELFKGILNALFGILIILIPTLLYFIINNCLSDFIYALFTMNIKYSQAPIKTKLLVSVNLYFTTKYYIFIFLTLIINVILFFSKKISNKQKLFITLFFIFTLILTATSANSNRHYLIQNAVSIILEIIFFMYVTFNKMAITKFLNYIIIIFLLFWTGYLSIYNDGILSNNISKDKIYKETTLNEIKNQLKESDEILVLGNNSYVYIYCGIQPDFKYFFQYPISTYDKNILIETNNYIINRKPKILVKNIPLKYFGTEINNTIQKYYYEKQEYYILKND